MVWCVSLRLRVRVMKKNYKVRVLEDLKLLKHFLQFKIFDSICSCQQFSSILLMFQGMIVSNIDVVNKDLFKKTFLIVNKEFNYRYGKRKKNKI